jgi:hypothetical protein
MTAIDFFVLAATLLVGALLVWPRLAGAKLWRATSTPLASIIGSGFLVLGPILDASFGEYAPFAMAGLCLVAYAFGWAVRFNIAAIEAGGRTAMEERVDTLGSWVLAFAYFISVAYYLNLFGAFAVDLTPFAGRESARLVTSAVFLLVLGVGWLKGFRALEGMERVSVGIKLAIIAGLLAGLAWFGARHVASGEIVLAPPTVAGWQALTLGFGLIVTVQGFETSRYLGNSYDATTRIRSMRVAQWLSTAIYVVYIVLLTYAFPPVSGHLEETEIIDMMRIVAVSLPVLLVVAALSAQFSAAIADTGGSGGLIHELSGGRLKPRDAYLLLVAIGLGLTWLSDIFAIIAYASRAFAAYYAVQAGLAAITAGRREGVSVKTAAFGGLALLGAAMAIFGTPVE